MSLADSIRSAAISAARAIAGSDPESDVLTGVSRLFLSAAKLLRGRTLEEAIVVLDWLAENPPGKSSASGPSAAVDAAIAAKFPASQPPPSDDGEGDGA